MLENRSHRVPAALNGTEFRKLQKLSRETGLPMARILLELARPGLTQIVSGKNPLSNIEKLKQDYRAEQSSGMTGRRR